MPTLWRYGEGLVGQAALERKTILVEVPIGAARVRTPLTAGTFTDTTVIPAIGAVKIPKDVDLKVASLIGCGVLTGVGAALNTATINKGDTVAVIGCGGVGLNVIQGARIAGRARSSPST